MLQYSRFSLLSLKLQELYSALLLRQLQCLLYQDFDAICWQEPITHLSSANVFFRIFFQVVSIQCSLRRQEYTGQLVNEIMSLAVYMLFVSVIEIAFFIPGQVIHCLVKVIHHFSSIAFCLRAHMSLRCILIYFCNHDCNSGLFFCFWNFEGHGFCKVLLYCFVIDSQKSIYIIFF